MKIDGALNNKYKKQKSFIILSYMYNLPLKFGVLLLAEPVLPLNNNGDWVRAKIPLAETGFRTFELGGVIAAENGKIRHSVVDFIHMTSYNHLKNKMV